MGRRRGSSAFPVARIKKMMQSDDDVGKIATVTPVLVAKALELMMEYVLKEAAGVASERHTKTVTPQHLKTCVMRNDSFDFLRDVLRGVEVLDEGKPRRRRKRPRSPGEVRRVRRREGRKEERVADAPEEGVQGVQGIVDMTAGKDDEEDDYDEDDEHAEPEDAPAIDGVDVEETKDERVSIPIEQKPAAERMSVSALLS